MRNIVYTMVVSLDGFIAGPNGELDWHVVDEEFHRFVNAEEARATTHLYGRRMYETMNAYWPTADRDLTQPDYVREYARIWQRIPKVVFSRTLERVAGDARLVRDDITGIVAELKAQPGGEMALGGAGIAATFLRLGLVDEIGRYVQPVVLGRGIPFFPAGVALPGLRLVDTHRFGSGVVYLHYSLEAVENR